MILITSANHYSKAAAAVTTSTRGASQPNIARAVAMKLNQDIASAKLPAIADVFNVGHYSTVSQTIRRLNALLADSQTLRDELSVISQDLPR